jgi:two-component system phosphate regulon response regulator PhoB
MFMRKLRAVAIDDVEDILDLIKYNLNKEGIDVDSFSTSEDALEHILQHPPDIVLSDWMMPDPDGLQVCRFLKGHAATRHIPIIMLTCKGSFSDYREALDAGAEDYIVKPVRMEELIRRVKLLLPQRSGRFNFGT